MSSRNDYIDEEQLRKALSVLKPDGELFELRVFGKHKGDVYSGYFTDADTAIDELSKIRLDGKSVFFTLNGINEACYGRAQHDEFMQGVTTTGDVDVVTYEWLLIDLDPIRPTDVSSSNEELELAREQAVKVARYLKTQGFEDPVIGMSGNGYHLLYNVGFYNSADSKKLVTDFLTAMALLFNTDHIKIDTVNFNPARICKMYGTVAQKGASTKDRPHRMAYIVSRPKEIRQTKRTYIEHVIESTLPKKEEPQEYNNFNPRTFDIREWMDRYGLAYTEKSGPGYTKFVLEHCPFDDTHRAPDSMITTDGTGRIGFKCLHNSCSERTWRDVRLKFEPDAYDNRGMAEEDDERINAGWKAHSRFNRDIAAELEEDPQPEEPMFLTAKQILGMPNPDVTYVPTGIEGIDNRMIGLKKGGISVLSGLRGGSKSTILTTICLNAVNQGYNVLAYSGELTAENFMRWMFLQAAGKMHVKPSQYHDGFFYVEDADKMKIAEWLGGHFVLYNNDYGNDFSLILKRLENQIAAQKTDVIILDNLMALDIRGLAQDKYDAQKQFTKDLSDLAKRTNTHIIFVAHPRKANGFLRLEDVSGSNDIVNLVDDAFIVHRNNLDFQRLSKEMFRFSDDHECYRGTNVIEIAKDRESGCQDVFIPLWYEPETKRLKNAASEMVQYGWDTDYLDDGDMDIPFNV